MSMSQRGDSSSPEIGQVLGHARQNVTELLAALARPPRTLCLRAGEVTIDIEWPDERPTTSTTVSTESAPELPAADPALVLAAQAVGVFYRAPEPGADPFVSEGDTVVAGQQVAIIEAMKLMIPVEAEHSGRITEVLKDDGQAVEYGEPLFALAASETA
jgi:acetyl-CoA carboxylase biotin carboxyl carrier protein